MTSQLKYFLMFPFLGENKIKIRYINHGFFWKDFVNRIEAIKILLLLSITYTYDIIYPCIESCIFLSLGNDVAQVTAVVYLMLKKILTDRSYWI